MLFDEILLFVKAASSTHSAFDFLPSDRPFADPYAVHNVTAVLKFISQLLMEDLEFDKLSKFCLISFMDQFGILCHLFLSKYRGGLIHLEYLTIIEVVKDVSIIKNK